jgi:1-acyl-sn-glycerol-3-phosphate acyltransferase
MVDPLYFIAFFPAIIHFVTAKELFLIPLFNRVIKALGCLKVPVKKEDNLLFAQSVSASLKNNGPIFFFYETGGKGAARFSKIFEAPMIPIKIKGSEKVLPFDSMILTPGVIEIEIGSPLDNSEELERWYK